VVGVWELSYMFDLGSFSLEAKEEPIFTNYFDHSFMVTSQALPIMLTIHSW